MSNVDVTKNGGNEDICCAGNLFIFYLLYIYFFYYLSTYPQTSFNFEGKSKTILFMLTTPQVT